MESHKSLGWKVIFSIILIIGIIEICNYGINYLEGYKTVEDCGVAVNQIYQPPPRPPFKWNGQPMITLWFDDAWKSQYTAAFPLMKKFGFLGALAVPTKFMCYPGFINWSELREMQAAGWEMTSHSVTHNCDDSYLNQPENAMKELVASKNMLTSEGLFVKQFAVPCGFSRTMVPVLVADSEKYYSSYRTATRAVNFMPIEDPYDLRSYMIKNTDSLSEVQRWINVAKKNNAWLIITFHQIQDAPSNSDISAFSTVYQYSITPEMFSQILTLIKNSGVQVVLPYQGLQAKPSFASDSSTQKS